VNQENINNWEVDIKFKDQYKHSNNQHRVLCECLSEEWQMKLKREFETFQKEQWKVKEKIMCEEFNRLMKKTKIIICEISMSNSLVRHKIVICLFEKFITKNEKQWLRNESYLFSEFLQRIRVIENQLQEKYNEYRLNLHSEWHVSAENDKYIKLIMNRESQWFKDLWRKANKIEETKNCKLS